VRSGFRRSDTPGTVREPGAVSIHQEETMERDEFARHLRRIERKLDEARDDLDDLTKQFKKTAPAEPPAAPAPKEDDPWK
jgi:hypothetical protein